MLNNEINKSYSSIIPHVTHPFYIVTPPYTRISAGITVLHLLCHYLNLSGERAFIVHYPQETQSIRILPFYAKLLLQKEFPANLIAPVITQEVIDFYDSHELTPIVIYPEVFDNPFNVSFFGRYILNYPGKLNTQYEQIENFSFAYTQLLAEHCTKSFEHHPRTEDCLFVPTADLTFWNTSGSQANRKGTCFYQGKVKGIFKTTLETPANSIEIKRELEMSREEIRDIFWKSEVFYCYEDSALAIESQLCGCPTIFVPNEHFNKPLAIHELWPLKKESTLKNTTFNQAKTDALNFDSIIKQHISNTIEQIPKLAQKWKNLAQNQAYKGTIQYPGEIRMVVFDHQLRTKLETDIINENEVNTVELESDINKNETNLIVLPIQDPIAPS